MLKTCDICRRREYCDSCALAEDCYWLRAVPCEGGRRLACESHQCKYYDTCRKAKMTDRKLD